MANIKLKTVGYLKPQKLQKDGHQIIFNKITMIEDIEKEIISYIDKKPKNSQITIKEIYEKFYINREDFSIGLPGYFSGWTSATSKIFQEYGLLKCKSYWLKK